MNFLNPGTPTRLLRIFVCLQKGGGYILYLSTIGGGIHYMQSTLGVVYYERTWCIVVIESNPPPGKNPNNVRD
jgi:hypothetical protein